MLVVVSLLIAAVVSSAVAAPATRQGQLESNSTVIDLGYAKYEGVKLEAGVNQYLQMRYAAPPLGNLRFRAPTDPQTESTVQDASAFGPVCVGVNQNTTDPTLAEDCLFINVFAPSNATKDSKLPVWFYIQGGGYATQSNRNYNGTDVIVQSNYNIVFVNFNYRVGALGFLASEKVRADGDLNAGLLDQRKALEWVQEYITLFGGDPNHVVVHGVSAGAGSLAYHLTAYGGRDDGLFVGGIGESVFWPTHRTVAESEFQFDRFVNQTSCSSAADPMSCLRSADIMTISSADISEPFPGGTDDPLPLWYFLPCIDGNFSQDYQYNLFEQGKFINVPIMFGDDTNEGSVFAPNASSSNDVSEFFRNNYPHLTDAQLDQINDAYPLAAPEPKHAAYFPSASAAYGDSTFTCPGNQICTSFTSFFSPAAVWNYRYNVRDSVLIALGIGVPHTTETPTIFGIGYAGTEGEGSSYETYNAPIVPLVMDYWLSFVQRLDPNPLRAPDAPLWENFGTGHGKRLLIQTNATAMEDIPDEQTNRCALWRSLATTLEQ